MENTGLKKSTEVATKATSQSVNLARKEAVLPTTVSNQKSLQVKGASAIASNTSSALVPSSYYDTTASDWSASMQTLLDRPPAKLPQWAIAAGTVSAVILFGWAWLGQIEEIGTAKGKLVPQGETYKVEPTDSGKVTQIEVKEGDTVSAGQMLLKLDTEIASKELQRQEQALAGYEEELSLKQALLEKANLESQANQKVAQTQLEAQQSDLANARENVNTIRQLLGQQQTEILAYRDKQTTLQPLTGWTKERLQQLQTEKTAHEERLQRLQTLVKEGAISQDAVFEAEAKLRQIQQQITQVQMQEIPNAQEQLFQAGQSLRELDARAVQQQGELDSAVAQIKQLTLQVQQKQQENASQRIADSQKIQQLELEIAGVNNKIAEARNQLDTTKTRLEQNWLTSPVDGTVLSLNLSNVGKVVNGGETVVEIAPAEHPLVLSAMLPNHKAGFVEPEMPVKVKLDAYPYQDYGLITGQTIEVSADSKQLGESEMAYEVKIALDRNYINNGSQRIEFKPGQTATAEIVIRRRRIIEIFLDPIKKLRKDGVNL